MKFRKTCSIILTALFILTALGGCESGSRSQTADQVLGSGSKVLRILSGSENSELEPILEQFANENDDMRIEMTHQGSFDIMRQLEQDKLTLRRGVACEPGKKTCGSGKRQRRGLL